VLARSARCASCATTTSKLAAATADRSIFTNAVAALTKKARGLRKRRSPRRYAVRRCDRSSFDEGLKKEREGFLQARLQRPVEGAALSFFSEREAAKEFAGVP